MISFKKFFKYLTLTFLFTFFGMISYASKNMEHKIKQLESKVIEFEREQLEQQNKNGYRNRRTIAKITGLNVDSEKSEVIHRSKEIAIEFPEFDPETKTVSVKGAPRRVRIDAKVLGSSYSGKIFINNNNATNNNNISFENGDLIISDANNQNHGEKMDITSKLEEIIKEERITQNYSRRIISTTAPSRNESVEFSEKEVPSTDVISAPMENNKNINVIIEGLDIINKEKTSI